MQHAPWSGCPLHSSGGARTVEDGTLGSPSIGAAAHAFWADRSCRILCRSLDPQGYIRCFTSDNCAIFKSLAAGCWIERLARVDLINIKSHVGMCDVRTLRNLNGREANGNYLLAIEIARCWVVGIVARAALGVDRHLKVR